MSAIATGGKVMRPHVLKEVIEVRDEKVVSKQVVEPLVLAGLSRPGPEVDELIRRLGVAEVRDLTGQEVLDALAEALTHVLDHEEEAAAMGACSLRRAETTFSFGTFLMDTLKVFSDAVKARRAS